MNSQDQEVINFEYQRYFGPYTPEMLESLNCLSISVLKSHLISNFGIFIDTSPEINLISSTSTLKYLATVTSDGINLYNLLTKTQELRISSPLFESDNIKSLTITQEYIYTGHSMGSINTYSISKRQLENQLNLHNFPVTSLCVSKNLKYLVSASAGKVIMWDLIKHKVKSLHEKIHIFEVACLTCSLINKKIYSGGRDKFIVIWDYKKHCIYQIINTSYIVKTFRMSHDESELIFLDSFTIKVSNSEGTNVERVKIVQNVPGIDSLFVYGESNLYYVSQTLLVDGYFMKNFNQELVHFADLSFVASRDNKDFLIGLSKNFGIFLYKVWEKKTRVSKKKKYGVRLVKNKEIDPDQINLKPESVGDWVSVHLNNMESLSFINGNKMMKIIEKSSVYNFKNIRIWDLCENKCFASLLQIKHTVSNQVIFLQYIQINCNNVLIPMWNNKENEPIQVSDLGCNTKKKVIVSTDSINLKIYVWKV